MTQAQGPFAQLPYSLWTFPDLLPLERWLCATIIRLCWKPGPQAFSYRTLAKESGISIGSLCHSPQHEGMIPKLERLKLIQTYKPVGDDNKIKKGTGFLIEPTNLLWQLNHQEQGAYSVSTSKPEQVGDGAYSVNTTAYLLSTSAQLVSTGDYSVSTKEALTQGQKCDDTAPIYIDSIDKNISCVASAHAESNEGISFLSQKEETVQEVYNGQTPLDASPNRGGHQQEEPVKTADTSVTPAATSAAHHTTHKEEMLQESPQEVALVPTLQDAPTKPVPTKETQRKGKSKIPEPVPLCSSRIIREAIDALRGYSLDESGAIIHQNIVLKEWCQKHTLEDFQHVIDHLTKGHCSNEKHQWWRQKNRMGTYFNADKLAELTPGVLSELGHIPKPAAPPEIAPQEEPKIVTWTPVMRITPPKGVTVIYG